MAHQSSATAGISALASEEDLFILAGVQSRGLRSYIRLAQSLYSVHHC